MATKVTSKFAPKVKDGYITYPSQFGSHKSMVDDSYILENEKLVVCVDEHGPYLTEKSRLDDRCADSNRNTSVEYRSRQLKNVKRKE